MPAAEVELDDRDKPVDRVFDLGDREEHLGMAHEAVRVFVSQPPGTKRSAP